jgi:hypothetical protein
VGVGSGFLRLVSAMKGYEGCLGSLGCFKGLSGGGAQFKLWLLAGYYPFLLWLAIPPFWWAPALFPFLEKVNPAWE